MNARERILLIVLASILGGGILLFGTYQWFFKPLRELDKKIADMRDKRNDAHAQVDQYLEDRKTLELARARSLPAHAADAGFEYMTNYLKPLLRGSGLDKVQVSKSPTAVDLKFTPTIPGVKVGHQVMTFQVHGEGDLSALVAALERLQRTPYEHRIKSLLINRADAAATSMELNPRLIIDMVIETLLVAKNTTKPGLPPGLDPTWIAVDHFTARHGEMPLGWGLLVSRLALQMSVPRPENRQYGQVADKNIFAGLIPYKEPSPPPPPSPKTPLLDVPSYVWLTTTTNQNEAHLRNIVYRSSRPGGEEKVMVKPGYDTFQIVDEDTGYFFFRAKVLRIDDRAMYFQIKDEAFEWELRKNLADAIKRPLSAPRLAALQLTLNAEWSAEESAKDKENKKPKTSSKKSSFFKGPTKTSK